MAIYHLINENSVLEDNSTQVVDIAFTTLDDRVRVVPLGEVLVSQRDPISSKKGRWRTHSLLDEGGLCSSVRFHYRDLDSTVCHETTTENVRKVVSLLHVPDSVTDFIEVWIQEVTVDLLD